MDTASNASTTEFSSEVWPLGKRQAWATLSILVLLSIVSQLDRQIISLLVAPISHDLGVTDFEIGLLQGPAFALFYATFGLPLGMAADRWPRRTIIFVGVTIWSLAAIACGLARTFNELLIARFIVGAGEAALLPCAYSLITDVFPRRRLSSAISVFSIGLTVGGSAAIAIGGLLIGVLGDASRVFPIVGELRPWQIVLVLSGLPGLILASTIFLFPEPKRAGLEQSPPPDFKALGQFMRSRSKFLACHFLGFALLAAMAYGLAAWGATLLMRRYEFSPGEAGGTIGLVFVISTLIGMPFIAGLVDWLFSRGCRDATLRVFLWFTPIVGICTAISCFMPNGMLYLLFFGIAQIGLSLGGPAAAALQLATPARLRSQVSAVFLFVLNMAGAGIGPLAIASLTVFVYRDPMLVHLSVATVGVIIAPLVALLFFLGLKPMREAIRQAGG